MKQVRRNEIEIDICTKCRGVWLDRGELEKLLAAVTAEAEGAAGLSAPQPQAPPPQAAPPRQERAYGYGEQGEGYGERGEYGEGYGHRPGQHGKKRFNIFDIFD